MKRILMIVLVLALLCGIALADESTLSVSGSGTVYMEADQVTATLGVNLNGQDLAALQSAANETIAGICDALLAAGLKDEDISTGYIYISPDYNSSSWSRDNQQSGYIVNHSLIISTQDTDKIGAYIDAAFAAGANNFDSVSFSVQDDSEARDKALELAVQEAGRKAKVIAEASGRNLGDILEINEGYQGASYNSSTSASYKLWAVEEAASSADTNIRAAQVHVSASVQIIYELK